MKQNKTLNTIGKIVWPHNHWLRFIPVIILIAGFSYLFMMFIYNPFLELFTGVSNVKLRFADSDKLYTELEFETLAKDLTRELRLKTAVQKVQDVNANSRNMIINILMNTKSSFANSSYSHIAYFRKSGIRRYEGPKTCLKCHETMTVHGADNKFEEVNTMDDVLNSSHFKFQSTATGLSTFSFDGKIMNGGGYRIPVGKMDRMCGVSSSMAWTGWASLIKSNPQNYDITVLRSIGCGQCHIGGNYQPAPLKIMPVSEIPSATKQGVDCLICHADVYDYNKKYVIQDANGNRWNQDRTLRAALTVGTPKNRNCSFCHEHNMNGDVYPGNNNADKPGYTNQRLIDTSSKPNQKYLWENGAHFKSGLLCTDCHIPQGHKLARGKKSFDLVANDLPNVKVDCDNCHTSSPHNANPLTRVLLNGHVDRIACETCHIMQLDDNNVVLRDWTEPFWNNTDGIWTASDIFKSGTANKGFIYLWYNGIGTYLASPLGNNPNKSTLYNPLMNQLTKITDPEIIAEIRMKAEELKKSNSSIDVDKYVESVTNTLSQLPKEFINQRMEVIEKYLRPLMNSGHSKIYPFKVFNVRMYEDMNNSGPFGALVMPFDYNTYFENGRPLDAAVKAVLKPLFQKMYQEPYRYYMMDEFMKYFGVGDWKSAFPPIKGQFGNIRPNWMRQMGTVMINHGISKQAPKCSDCHSENGKLDFVALGYTPARINELLNLPEAKLFSLLESGHSSDLIQEVNILTRKKLPAK